MKIRDLLEGKGRAVEVVAASATLADAVARLARQRIGALVASGDGREVEGILSERDVVRLLAADGADCLRRRVAEVMTTTVVTCGPDDDVISLMGLMTERRIRHVPVVDQGVLAGIVSIGDVVKSSVDQLERDRKELLDYVSGR